MHEEIKSKNLAHFPRYPPPAPYPGVGVGAVVTIDWCIIMNGHTPKEGQ